MDTTREVDHAVFPGRMIGEPFQVLPLLEMVTAFVILEFGLGGI